MASYPDTILQLNNGAAVAELTSALTKILAAVRESGKPGSITFTVTVKPASKGVTSVVMVESKIKTQLPEPDRGMTVFYLTDDNRLVRNDPRQQALPLRVVEIEQPNELKEIL